MKLEKLKKTAAPFLCLPALSAFVLSACAANAPALDSSGPQSAENRSLEASPAIESGAEAVPAETGSALPKPDEIKTLVSLIGETDSEAIELLGEGSPSYNGEGVLLERGYTLPILGKDSQVALDLNLYRYGEDRVDQIVVTLGDSDLQSYADSMEQLFGEPVKTYEKSYFFSDGDVTLVLADPYGDVPYIEITGELDEN